MEDKFDGNFSEFASEVFINIRNKDFRQLFEILSLQEKVALLSMALSEEAPYNKIEDLTTKEEKEIIDENIFCGIKSVICGLSKTDKIWSIYSIRSGGPYVFHSFREESKDDPDYAGLFVFLDEETAISLIDSLDVKDAFVQEINEPYDFLRSMLSEAGYVFANVFSSPYHSIPLSEEFFRCENARLNIILAELKQIGDKETIEKRILEKKLVEELHRSFVYVPSTYERTDGDIKLGHVILGDMPEKIAGKYAGKNGFPIFTDLMTYSTFSSYDKNGCVLIRFEDALKAAKECDAVPVLNPMTYFFVFDERIAGLYQEKKFENEVNKIIEEENAPKHHG